MPARRWDAGTIDSDHITFRVDSSPLLSHHLRVHLDASLADQDFACPARGNSGSSQDLLEPYALCGLGHWGGSWTDSESDSLGPASVWAEFADAAASWPSSASSSSTSGNCGASGGKSSNAFSPIRSRK
jgi:hypothetical protein